MARPANPLFLIRSFKPLVATCLLLSLVGPWLPAQAAGWPQAGYDAAGSSFNPDEALLNAQNVISLRPTWSRKLDPSKLVSADNQAFVTLTVVETTGTYRRQLARLNVSNGKTQWQVDAPDSYASPAILNDLVVVAGEASGTYDGQAVAFDRSTGAVRWTYTLPESLTQPSSFLAPVVQANRVYLLSRGGEAVVLDAVSGTPLWRRRVDNAAYNYPRGMSVADGRVFVTDYERGLITLDAADGHELWRYALPPLYNAESRPLAVAGSVLFNDHGGRVHALNASNGEVRWVTTTPFRKAAGGAEALASDGQRVYALNGVSYQLLSALDLANGAILWTVNPGTFAKDLTVANNVLYFIGSTLNAVDPATGGFIPVPLLKSANAAASHLTLADGQLFTESLLRNGKLVVQAWGLPTAP